MVLIFIPPYNTSEQVCDSVLAYEAGRNPPSQAFIDVHIALFTLLTVICLGSIPLVWHYRDAQRFRKIRPFWITTLTLVLIPFYLVASNISEIGKLY
jgi:hypothetical protein